MDYIKLHHLWRPLAAITTDKMGGYDQPHRSLIVGSSHHRNDLDLHNNDANEVRFASTLTTRTTDATTSGAASSFLASTTTAASGMLGELDDELWQKILFSMESNNMLLDHNESLQFARADSASELSYFGYYDSLNNSRNGSGNGSLFTEEFPWEMVPMIGTAVVLGLLILATVIGNVFVIAAILLERNLQNVANYLILSLAVADLLVACLVMPLGAVYEVSHEWTLGPELCDMWTSSDVLCCTASILHLVAIALDRYWAVTNIDYIHHRTAKRIGIMILIVWCVAFLVCIAPLLGWKDPGWSQRIEDNKCIVSQDISYQIFATASSFYLPLMVILILYWRIFQTARKRIRRRQILTQAAETKDNPAMCGIAGGLAGASASGGIAAAVVTIIGRPLPTISETTTTAFTNVSSNNTSPEKASCANGLDDPPTTTDGDNPYPGGPQHVVKRKSNKYSADSKRERKAAKTLAIITGAFVICWLPFFVMAVLLPIYKDLFEEYVISLFLWLGYFNSTLNPIIYTIFSPEFRHAFKKILFGRNYARRRQKQFNIKHFQ